MANELELGTGLLQYGTFRFPNAIKSKISARAVDDSTSRFTKYVVHRIEIETVLYPGVDENSADPFFPASADSADGLNSFDAMDRVRQVLSTRGNALTFQTKGYGTFEINTLKQDVLTGPNPEILNWEPIGDNFAVRVVWGVEVTIAECSRLSTQAGKFTEFSYSIGWGIDLAGLTTRTISGHWDVVISIAGGSVRNNADQKRDFIRFDIPSGFGRTRQEYILSERRDRMDFTIVDTEYAADDKNRLPAGVVQIDVTQSTRTVGSLLSSKWSTTIGGNITVAKGKPRFLAWIAFLQIVHSRLTRAREEGNIPADSKGNPEDYGPDNKRPMKNVLLRNMSISEDIYGRSMNFSISWLAFSTIKNIINAAGIFQEIPGATERGQITSLVIPGGAWTPRGQKGLAQTANEPLVGICESQSTLTLQGNGRKTSDTIGDTLFENKRPEPEDSWLCFESRVVEQKDTKRYSSGPADGLLSPVESGFVLGGTSVQRTTTGASTGQNTTQIQSIHQSAGAASRLIWKGKAARLGYAVPEVHLLKYAGATVTPTGRGTQVNCDPIDAAGVLLYRSSWEKEYTFSAVPDQKVNNVTDPSPTDVNLSCAGFGEF